MWTLLFDIDGTLIRTKGAGFHAIERALGELFGVRAVPRIPVHGRTDRAIISDLFAEIEKAEEMEAYLDQFHELYWNYLPDSLEQLEGSVLPGVSELLPRLAERDDVSLGLLTGNAKVPALHKLRHFGLDSFFHFGGYGDQESCRNKVAAAATESARQHLGPQFVNSKIWVIGDTVKDIECARSIQSRVVAVETGGGSREQLAANRPDVLLPDLADVEAFEQTVLAG